MTKKCDWDDLYNIKKREVVTELETMLDDNDFTLEWADDGSVPMIVVLDYHGKKVEVEIEVDLASLIDDDLKFVFGIDSYYDLGYANIIVDSLRGYADKVARNYADENCDEDDGEYHSIKTVAGKSSVKKAPAKKVVVKAAPRKAVAKKPTTKKSAPKKPVSRAVRK